MYAIFIIGGVTFLIENEIVLFPGSSKMFFLVWGIFLQGYSLPTACLLLGLGKPNG